MPTFHLRRFSSPETLRAMAPVHLLAFLEPYRDYFASHGLRLPTDPDGDVDFEQLVRHFMLPELGLPKELLDALFLVDEMSTPWGMDVLAAAARQRRLPLQRDEATTPADVAAQVWMLDPSLLESKHAEQYLLKPRSFEHYFSDRPTPSALGFADEEACRAMERDLDDWFEEKNRGRGTRLFVYHQENEVWLLVRHGEPFKREESLQGQQTGSVCYRPLKYDVLVYRPDVGELRINARSAGQKQVYRQLVGRHFFGDRDHFPGDVKYTLEPIRAQGERCLVCVDVPALEEVVLREVEFYWHEPVNMVEIRKSDNLFLSLWFRNAQALEEAEITRAVFQVKFADAKRPRSVTIRAGNRAQYTRDSDVDHVEQWLRLRGFLHGWAVQGKGAGDESVERA